MPLEALGHKTSADLNIPKLASQGLTAAFCRSARPRMSETASGPRPAQTDYPDLDVRGLALLLSDRAVALIRYALQLQATRRKGESEFVFPSPHSNDAPIEPAALSRAMADLTAALDLEDVRLHDLRRTGATGIAALGVPPFIVSKVLAHKDGGGGAAITARHYNLYAYAVEKRAALDQWSTHLERLLGSRRADQTLKDRSGTSLTMPVGNSGPPSSKRLWTELVEPREERTPPNVFGEPLWTDLVEG